MIEHLSSIKVANEYWDDFDTYQKQKEYAEKINNYIAMNRNKLTMDSHNLSDAVNMSRFINLSRGKINNILENTFKNLTAE